jgi:hypothetical protein
MNDINQPFMATRALTPDDCVESVLSVEIRWLRRQAHDEKYVSIKAPRAGLSSQRIRWVTTWRKGRTRRGPTADQTVLGGRNVRITEMWRRDGFA